MNKRRVHISIFLMSIAIIAVLGFQLYWLNKNYQEEKQLLSLRTNVLFREAIYQTQAAILNLDTTIRVRTTSGMQAVGVMNQMRYTTTIDTAIRIRAPLIDTSRSRESSFVISMKDDRMYRGRTAGDTGLRTVQIYNRPGQEGLIRVLRGVDSLQDSIRVHQIAERYSKLLENEKIDVGFAISRKESARQEDPLFREMEDADEVTIGFFRPLTFGVQLQNTNAYIFKRLRMPILVSILLVGITVFSFILLLRNYIQQRRLTQLKNDFISNITHELKTPIATVSVAIEALKNFNALQDPKRTQEYLSISASELQRLSMLVDKVLKLSMFEKQQMEVKEEVFDLKELVDEVVSSMRLQFEKYQAHIEVNNNGSNFMLKADRLHITSVIFNLLDNALKYSISNPSIIVALNETANGIELSVRDNGIGISPEYRKRIFEKFFRVPSGNTHNVKGYGLGLSYVAHVVNMHKGSINLESVPSAGSKFTVTLPGVRYA
ncbi:MAG: hypothetical protein H7Y31_11770 [Chitinophagaceae bacterium]|nr:hypothetical protein [Chitinophagaceae bacterium]